MRVCPTIITAHSDRVRSSPAVDTVAACSADSRATRCASGSPNASATCRAETARSPTASTTCAGRGLARVEQPLGAAGERRDVRVRPRQVLDGRGVAGHGAAVAAARQRELGDLAARRDVRAHVLGVALQRAGAVERGGGALGVLFGERLGDRVEHVGDPARGGLERALRELDRVDREQHEVEDERRRRADRRVARAAQPELVAREAPASTAGPRRTPTG